MMDLHRRLLELHEVVSALPHFRHSIKPSRVAGIAVMKTLRTSARELEETESSLLSGELFSLDDFHRVLLTFIFCGLGVIRKSANILELLAGAEWITTRRLVFEIL
jgi:hypothetical protein